MTKGRFFLIFLAALGILILGPGGAWAAKINIDVNCTMKPGGSEEVGIKKFKEVVEKESGGRMNVKIFMSGQLGSEEAVLELLKIGQTQMSLTGGTFRHNFAPKWDPISIPFYLPSFECVEAYLASPTGQNIAKLAAERGGLIPLGPQKRAARHMTSNRKVVEPEDLKALKMRLPSEPVFVDVWKELGALPTVIPAPEIYLAMKTGQVEAHENTLVGPYSRKMWEVQKYIILTAHSYFPWEWVTSKVWFDKLSNEDQTLIRKAANIARAAGAKAEDELDAFYVKELKKHGMEFITPNRKAFLEKAQPAVKRALAKLDPAVEKEVAKVCK